METNSIVPQEIFSIQINTKIVEIKKKKTLTVIVSINNYEHHYILMISEYIFFLFLIELIEAMFCYKI